MPDHEAIVEQYYEELFNEGSLDIADEILAEDVQYHGPRSVTPGTLESPSQVKAFVKRYHGAFPDIDYHVESVFRSGDQVAVRWTSEGTHTEDLFGIEGQGEEFTGTGLNVFEFEDGKIAEVWSYWDTLGMVRELGLVAPMGLASKQ
ncbi:MAG: ester cyclase [Halobacteriota archaeon]